MKLNKKNSSILIQLVVLSMIIGTLVWTLIVILLKNFGIELDFTIGKIGFDLVVISFSLLLNPGSLLGAAGGFILFYRL